MGFLVTTIRPATIKEADMDAITKVPDLLNGIALLLQDNGIMNNQEVRSISLRLLRVIQSDVTFHENFSYFQLRQRTRHQALQLILRPYYK